MALFDGFDRRRLSASGTEMNFVIGGGGPPLLLLHGYPQTHAIWHLVAPGLAREFTVVAPDLRGYGDSGKPAGGPGHVNYTKRAQGALQVELMTALGFDRFFVAGHDRGARVAYRMALDWPERVSKLATLDIVPTIETWERLDGLRGLGAYHWFFLAQPHDLPERLIGADPDYFLDYTLASWSGSPQAFAPEAIEEYRRCFRDKATIHATCEDYRAGAGADVEHDAADRGRRRIACPMLVLWGGRKGFGPSDCLEVWKRWADDVRGAPIDSGHFLPEEAPAATERALREFFRP